MLDIPQIPKFSFDARNALGKAYAKEILDVKAARDELLQNTWIKALENYEGKAPKRTFPFPGASNAVVPITPTHTDAIFARLYNTATGQDPKFLITPWGTGEMASGATVEEFAEQLQFFSQYLEKEEIDVTSALELALMLMAKYGDSIVYIPWEHMESETFDYDIESGEFAKTKNILKSGPTLRVIQPEDFFIPVTEHGPQALQEARWLAYSFQLDLPTLKQWKASGFYDSKTADFLLDRFYKTEKEMELEKRNWFQRGGDGSYHNPTDLQERREELIGVDADPINDKLDMVHVFAREDLEDKGALQEINFHLHVDTGSVPRIAYNHYAHKRRPFIRFSYTPRDGVFYSIGVPEMLFNIQAILNQTMRDILDNNKVQNTKVFLVRRNGPVDQGLRVYPGPMIFVDNVQTDFMPIDMGTGREITSVQDLMVMQDWGERRTGITDFNLGQEKTSRTPATTTLALLDESNKRIDLVVRRMREQLVEMWTQVVQLYAQFGTQNLARSLVGLEEGRILEEGLASFTPEEIRRKVVVNAQVSTQNLNRSIRRQESLALFGQVQQYYEQVIRLVQAIQTSQDPALVSLLKAMLRGGRQVMRNFYSTFDIKDQDDLNPDFETLAEDVTEVPLVPPTPGQSNQVSAATAALEGQGAAAGPINPPGRPEPGFERPSPI
jgi:hypothetical protein